MLWATISSSPASFRADENSTDDSLRLVEAINHSNEVSERPLGVFSGPLGDPPVKLKTPQSACTMCHRASTGFQRLDIDDMTRVAMQTLSSVNGFQQGANKANGRRDTVRAFLYADRPLHVMYIPCTKCTPA